MAVVAGRFQVALDRGVRQVAGRHDVRDRDPRCDAGLPGLGQVDLQEAAVPAVEEHERVDRLDHAGAGRPSAADARRQRDHGHLAPMQRRLSALRSPPC